MSVSRGQVILVYLPNVGAPGGKVRPALTLLVAGFSKILWYGANGCAADGATYQDALTNVQKIINEWIDTARDLGRPIPSPRGRLLYA